MELQEKVANLPLQPGVYLFKDALGTILYVGKARVLRHRVKSYFLESKWADAKTGSLVREIADVDCIVVDNEKEALALENSLIKQNQPKFNVLLRDDKTYPYIRYTAFEKYPRVYVTRRLKKDGSIYFGPYFPHSLAHRIVHLIHKRFLVPSCTVDLTRPHPRPCLQYYIKRCLGPCVPGLTTDERYAEAARDVRLFLEGRRSDLVRSLEGRMQKASEEERYEAAAQYRDLIRTVEEIEERQKIAAAQGDDTDVLAWYAEPPQVAVNLFHLRGGRVVDRRDFYWEELEEFDAAEFLPALLKQLYLEAEYLPRQIHVPPVAPGGTCPERSRGSPARSPAALKGGATTDAIPRDFDDRALLEDILSERAGRRIEIHTPQRGQKRAFLDLVAKNARQSFDQRFRVLQPNSKAIAEALEAALNLPEPPKRIESFDISHIQGSDTVASMVVWEDGRMKKSDYRKFIIRGVGVPDTSRAVAPAPALPPLSDFWTPVESIGLLKPESEVEGSGAEGSSASSAVNVLRDDFASIREAVERRYRRLQEERKPLPSLILIDGGLGQLHAAAQAFEKLEIINQPLASIAKPGAPASSPVAAGLPRHDTDTIYVHGQEDEPIRLERHSPILHLVQQIRDETHRFAVTFHRQRRTKRTLRSELTNIPGIGQATARKLLRKFGSLARIQQASFEELAEVISAKQARAILENTRL